MSSLFIQSLHLVVHPVHTQLCAIRFINSVTRFYIILIMFIQYYCVVFESHTLNLCWFSYCIHKMYSFFFFYERLLTSSSLICVSVLRLYCYFLRFLWYKNRYDRNACNFIDKVMRLISITTMWIKYNFYLHIQKIQSCKVFYFYGEDSAFDEW